MNTKLEQFIKRNKRRNKHLYDIGLIAGYDYVICPVSNERLSMIKSSYIEKILLMSVADYDSLYPHVQKICRKRVDNIKDGLQQIDITSGLTKYQISQVKAKEILQIVGEDGLTGYARKGKKTRQTHMNNLDEYGRNGYSVLATKAIIKGNDTKAKKGLIVPPERRGEFYRYKSVVTYLTERVRKELTYGYQTGLAGEDGAYHIDHIYSIMHGYTNKVSPLVIGNIKNMKMIPWEENLEKSRNSSIKLNDLLTEVGYTIEQSLAEFEYVIQYITEAIASNLPVSGAYILEKLNETTLSK
jgi:hypothetical protein